MKKIKAWMHRHHNTISSFLCNFSATVLGIVLTLGTTVLYDRHQEAEAAEALVEQCLDNMDERLADLDDVIEYYNLHDTIFQVMNSTPLESMSEDELNNILNVITIQKHLIVNQAYEKLFSQSTNILETLGRFSQVIGEGFEALSYAEKNHAAVNAIKSELTREMVLSNNAYYAKGSMLDVMQTMEADPRYVIFCSEFTQHEHSIRYIHGFLKYFVPAARRLWQKEMTYDEFWEGAKGGWKNR